MYVLPINQIFPHYMHIVFVIYLTQELNILESLQQNLLPQGIGEFSLLSSSVPTFESMKMLYDKLTELLRTLR